jgi:hypothetical protein
MVLACLEQYLLLVLAAVLVLAQRAAGDSVPPTFTHSVTTLSIPRYAMAATTVDGQAVFAGGTQQGTPHAYSAVDIFDSNSNSWSTAALSVARNNLAATSVGDVAIFAGGALSFRDDTFSSQVDRYNAISRTWSTAALSTPRNGIGAATVGNKAYFAGGISDAQAGAPTSFSNVLDIYDLSSNTWSATTMPHTRYNFTPAVVGTKIIFFGGGTSTVDVLDTAGNSWESVTISTEATAASRTDYSAAVIGNRALFYGGQYGGQPLRNLDIYDAGTNNWTSSFVPSNVAQGASATLPPYALFGGGDYTAYSDDVELYDASTNEFSPLDRLSQPRTILSALYVGDRVIFAGGYNGSASDVVDVYALVPEPSSTAILPLILLALISIRPSISRRRVA